MPLIACLDIGSTFTKAALVDVSGGGLLAASSSATTSITDVMHGVQQCLDDVAARVGRNADEVRLCSSAGGGLRLAVVGYERAVSAEAGRRVALTAGGHVVHVTSGLLRPTDVQELLAARPDVVLLVGGTDGGNAEVLLANAHSLARSNLPAPVVAAGNADVRDDVVDLLRAGDVVVHAVDNVLPAIGTLDPQPARAALRGMFLEHVIGGKHLSSSRDFAALVRAATPDAVLAGVELFADGAGSVPGAGDVLVVDIGGATTDVYSVVTRDPEDASLGRDVVELQRRQRTVEGDLGMRWSAPGVVSAAVTEQLLEQGDLEGLASVAARRHHDPGLLPVDHADCAVDHQLARLALTIALRRHARPSLDRDVRVPGVDLRQVQTVIGSGGVLRHSEPKAAREILAPALSDVTGGWRMPERADLRLDRRYVLAAAGLLAHDHAEAAAGLLRTHLAEG
ncbi:MAG: glutamate mutase L [Candidatus Nanopelagicales bacterium]